MGRRRRGRRDASTNRQNEHIKRRYYQRSQVKDKRRIRLHCSHYFTTMSMNNSNPFAPPSCQWTRLPRPDRDDATGATAAGADNNNIMPPFLPSFPIESETDMMMMAMVVETPTATTRIPTKTPPMLSFLMPPSAGPPPPGPMAADVPPSVDVRPVPTWWHSIGPFRVPFAHVTIAPRAPTTTASPYPATVMIPHVPVAMRTAADRRSVITEARINVGGICWANVPSIMALRNRATATMWSVGGHTLAGPRRIRRHGNC